MEAIARPPSGAEKKVAVLKNLTLPSHDSHHLSIVSKLEPDASESCRQARDARYRRTSPVLHTMRKVHTWAMDAAVEATAPDLA